MSAQCRAVLLLWCSFIAMQIILLLLLVATAAAVPTFDAVRAPLRAKQAAECWPPALAVLINTTLEALADTSATSIGRFYALFAEMVTALRPVCPAYAIAARAVARAYHDPVENVEPPPQADLEEYCRDSLAGTGAVSTTDTSLPNDDPLRSCMTLGDFSAKVGYLQ